MVVDVSKQNKTVAGVFFKRQGCFNIFFLLFSLPFFLIGAFGIYKEIQIKMDGKVAIGTVERLRISYGDESDSYHVHYRFITDDNLEVTDNCQVSYRTFDELREGSEITLIYSETNPANSRMVGESYLLFHSIFGLVGGILLGAALLWMVKGILYAKKVVRLFEQGIETVGHVVTVEKLSYEVNERRMGRLHYAFKDMYGQEHKGKSCNIYYSDLMEFYAGDEVDVLYDESDPEINVWAEEGEYC